MATMIRFSGVGGDSVTVEESPEQILAVLDKGHSSPLLLTRNGMRDGVYIVPARIACWYRSSGDDEPPLVPLKFKGPI